MCVLRDLAEDTCSKLQHSEGQTDVIGEILTWLGVGIAALATFALYRSAERSNLSGDSKDDD
jgi:hypothetical protein